MTFQTQPEECLKRAQGCLLGLAVGDAYGDIGRSDVYRNRYGIIGNLYEGAKSTDDTEFAVLTARTLIDCQGNLSRNAVLESWKKYILAQGGIFERGGKPQYGALENLTRGILPPLSGRYNVQNNDDGAAMRIAPVGILCAGDPERAARLAEIDAEISHWADGIWAAQAVAASVAVAMGGGSVEEILKIGMDQIPFDSWLGTSMRTAMDLCDQHGTIEAAWEDLHTRLWTPVHSMAAEAIPQAFAVIRLTGADFIRGMWWGGNFGRDADTIGAVIGAVCGARQGVEVIPAAWIEKVRRPSGVCLKFAAQEDLGLMAGELVRLMK